MMEKGIPKLPPSPEISCWTFKVCCFLLSLELIFRPLLWKLWQLHY
jgi:hypothetical protein